MTKDAISNEGGTLKIRRPSKIKMDERGHAVWVGAIEPADFELVPTERIRAILESGDKDRINEISQIARTGPQGVLIQDCIDGHISVLASARFENLLQAPDSPVVREPDDQDMAVSATEQSDNLQLMDTQILRKILASERKIDPLDLDENKGSNPYDTGKIKDWPSR
jgi:hypothetical protein